MKQRYLITIGVLWIFAGLVLGGCQRQTQSVSDPETTQPAAVRSTDAARSVSSVNTSIPFVFPTETLRPPDPTEESGLQVLWTFQTGGAIWATPAVENGMVYIGSDDGSLYAIDARTGQKQWQFNTGGIVRSCPAIANGLVMIASDDGFVYALHPLSGKQVWKTDIGNAFPLEIRQDLGNSPDPTGYDYRQSSPVFAEGLVYVGSLDGNVYALNASDGSVTWKFETGAKVRATPTVVDGIVFIGSWDKKAYALDARTGQMLWATPLSGQVQSTALVIEDLVITASRKASVQALDLQTGKLVWEYDYGPNLWVESSPSLAGGRIIIGSSGGRKVVAIDYKTGSLAWMFSSESFNWSTPLPVADTVYVGGVAYNNPAKGGLYVLKVTEKDLPFNNVQRRIFSVMDTLETSGSLNGVAGSPVMVDGVLFFGALDGKLYAVRD